MSRKAPWITMKFHIQHTHRTQQAVLISVFIFHHQDHTMKFSSFIIGLMSTTVVSAAPSPCERDSVLRKRLIGMLQRTYVVNEANLGNLAN